MSRYDLYQVDGDNLVEEIYEWCYNAYPSRTINEVERCVQILHEHINVGEWVDFVNEKMVIADRQGTRNPFPLYLGYGLKKAMSFHLLNLLKQLDERYGFGDGNMGFAMMFRTVSGFDDDSMEPNSGYLDLFIRYPEGFIFWNLDRLMDETLIKLLISGLGINIVDFSEIFKLTKQVANVFYLSRFGTTLFQDVEQVRNQKCYFSDSIPSVLDIVMVILHNHYFIRYEEELIGKSWEAPRFLDWCLDKEEKAEYESDMLSDFL
jgi:hypothetical protein